MTWQRALTPEQEVALCREYEEDGWTVNDMSVIYRVSVRTVYRILAKYAVPRHVKRTTHRKYKEPKGRKLKPYGTNAAYQRHRRNDEYPCVPCLAAHAQDVQKAKNKAKRRKKA